MHWQPRLSSRGFLPAGHASHCSALVRPVALLCVPAGHGVGDAGRGVVAVARAGELADDRGAVRVEERVGARVVAGA